MKSNIPFRSSLIRSLALASVTVASTGLLSYAHADDLESLLNPTNGDAPKAAKVIEPSVLSQVILSQLKAANPSQREFLSLIDQNQWDQALVAYFEAFKDHEFTKSVNGQALLSALYVRAGLPLIGLEHLFQSVSQPGQIHPEIRQLLKDHLPATHYAWNLANIEWNKEFAQVFAPDVAYHMSVKQIRQIKDVKKLKELYSTLPSGSLDRARAGWQLVTAYSLAGNIEEAGRVLADLLKAPPYPVSRELMEITAGRLLYQKGIFAAAIKYYEKVPRSSEYWTDAQEEMAWAFIRKGEPQNALALTKSLVVPIMAVQSGAESFFVQSVAQLKLCDYAGALTTLAEFPKTFKARKNYLDRLAQTSEIPEVKKLMTLLQEKRITRAQLGKEALALPRMVARDEQLFELAQEAKHLSVEANRSSDLLRRSQQNFSLNSSFERFHKTMAERSFRAHSAANLRVQNLAKQESSEIQEILKKLRVVDAEVIQQLTAAEKTMAKAGAASEPKMGSTGSKARDVLKFKADQEVWFDEIGNFKVDVKRFCQLKNKGKST